MVRGAKKAKEGGLIGSGLIVGGEGLSDGCGGFIALSNEAK
ncbi:MAG: hypothetical protein SFY66_23245 [Oculatellaceae cyanobacterium bins.114]|nr:hypothetical protein [Oculatellaceae cyanobacterium bins.114]